MVRREAGSSGDREAWLQRRKQRIGCSEVAAIMGLNPHQTPWEVFADKTGRIEPEPDNQAKRLGRTLEANILDEAERTLGKMERDIALVVDELHLGATLDSRVLATNQPCQAKTAGLLNPMADLTAWGQAQTDQIPEMYLVQIHAEMICSEAELGHLWAFIAGRSIVPYQIERSRRITDLIEEFVPAWWQEHIIEGHEPPIDVLPLKVAKRVKREPDKIIDFDQRGEDLWMQRTSLKAESRGADKESKGLEAQILTMMGDAEGFRLPDGKSYVYKEVSRKGYTVGDSKYRMFKELK